MQYERRSAGVIPVDRLFVWDGIMDFLMSFLLFLESRGVKGPVIG